VLRVVSDVSSPPELDPGLSEEGVAVGDRVSDASIGEEEGSSDSDTKDVGA